MQRGDIWWASLPKPDGSGPGFRRPVVIVQADTFNMSSIRTVVVVIITKNLKFAGAPGNVFLSRKKTGLPHDCLANVSQVYTIDKDYLTERVNRLPAELIRKIEAGLRLVLLL